MSVRIVPGESQRQDGDDVRSLFSHDEAVVARGQAARAPAGGGPLTPRIPRPPRRRLARPPLRLPSFGPVAPRVWLVAAVLAVAVAVTAVWAFAGGAPQDGPLRPPAGQAGAAESAAGQAGAATASDGATDAGPATDARPDTGTATADSPRELSVVPWQGAALPISDVHGPTTLSETRSFGFTDTPLGAALAAVHISTHIDAYTGPAVFAPTIKQQVIGDPDGLLQRTRRAYRAAADRVGVTGGDAILAPTGEVRSWRIRGLNPGDAVDVDLLVVAPAGQRLVYRVPLRWRGGDWRLVVRQGDTGEVLAVSAAGKAKGFTRFLPDLRAGG